jgi:hypothetical protein
MDLLIHVLTLEARGNPTRSPNFFRKKTEHSALVSKYFSRVQCLQSVHNYISRTELFGTGTFQPEQRKFFGCSRKFALSCVHVFALRRYNFTRHKSHN